MTIDWNPDIRKLRTFGWVCAGIFLILCALFVTRCGAFAGGGSVIWSAFLFSCALVVAFIAVVRPAFLKFIHLALAVATYPIGWTMSLILFCLVYYLVFTPFALFFRIIGRDVLQRRSSPQSSYWIGRKQERTPESYLRTF